VREPAGGVLLGTTGCLHDAARVKNVETTRLLIGLCSFGI